jgi:hypothetical protein
MQVVLIGGSWSKAGPGQKQDPIWKITKVKRARGVAQVVEYLPSKFEALSSNPNTAKKTKLAKQILLTAYYNKGIIIIKQYNLYDAY